MKGICSETVDMRKKTTYIRFNWKCFESVERNLKNRCMNNLIDSLKKALEYRNNFDKLMSICW